MRFAVTLTREDAGRIAGWGVGLGTLSLLTAGTTMLVLFAVRNPGRLPAYTGVAIFYDVLLVLAFAIVSVAVLRRHPRHPIGWLLGVVGAAVAFALFTSGFAAWDLPGTRWVLWLWLMLVTGPFLFSLGMALLLFPTGRPASRRWRWWARTLWAYLGAATLVNAVTPWPPDTELFEVPLQEHLGGWPAQHPIGWDVPGWLADINSLVPIVGVLLLLVSASSLVGRWRRSVGDERQQIKWLALAGLLFTLEISLGLIQALTVGFPDDDAVAAVVGGAIFLLALAAIPVAMGFGIVRYRLYDIDVLVSRTIVYGGLAVFIALAYAVGVVVVGEAVSRWAGASTVLALTVTTVVAAAFHPLRARLQTSADRWVFGDRAAPYELMARFGHQLGQALAPSDVLAQVADTAGRAVRATAARVTVTLPNGEHLAARWPAAAPATSSDALPRDMVVPVHDGDAVIAEIAVAQPSTRAADRALLEHTAAVTAGAIRNLRLIAELDSLHARIERQNRQIEASRQRLVAATQDERRNIEELVTQRLGPDLDVLQDMLPTLGNERDTRPERVAAECERLTAHATRLVDEIRALSRGVLPTILTDHGLQAALRALLRRTDIQAILETAPPVADTRYPAHIETAAYLCCHSALQAAAQQGGVLTGTVRLWQTNADLGFSVTLDAPLPPQDAVSAARDRIAALRGRTSIVQEGQQTSLTGAIPISMTDDLAEGTTEFGTR